MGCNIVITRKGDAYEYFRDDAYYCDPESPDSIFKAVDQAARSSKSKYLSSRVREQFNWNIAAKKTMEAYHEILRNKG